MRTVIRVGALVTAIGLCLYAIGVTGKSVSTAVLCGIPGGATVEQCRALKAQSPFWPPWPEPF